MFQSTPVIANGRIAAETQAAELDRMFQSTPVIANGRILSFVASGVRLQRFNPRPLLLTGEWELVRERRVRGQV